MIDQRMDAELQKRAKIAFAISVIGVGLGYSVHACLTNWMGAVEYGILAVLLAFIQILSVPSTLGMEVAAQRFVPSYLTQNRFAELKGFFAFSRRLAFGLALLVGLVWAGFMWAFRNGSIDADPIAVAGGVLLLALVAAGKVLAGTLRALRHFVAAGSPQALLDPALFALFAGITLVLFGRLDATAAMGGKVLASLVVVALFAILLRKYDPTVSAEPIAAVRHGRVWVGASSVILVVMVCQVAIAEIGTILTGLLVGEVEAGIFSVTLKTAGLVAFVLHAFNYLAAPKIAALHAAEENRLLNNLVATIAARIFLLTLPLAAFLMVFAKPVLGVFGPAYVGGSAALHVLVAGQLANAAVGVVAVLLILTGHHRTCARVFVACAILNVVATAVGVRWWGVFGAAVANAAVVALCNAWLAILAFRVLRINTTVFQRSGWKTSRKPRPPG